MGLVGFSTAFVFWSFVLFVAASVLLGRLPWTRSRRGIRLLLAALLAGLGGYRQGLSTVEGFADSAVRTLADRPKAATTMSYLVGDYLPLLRRLGATIRPEWRRAAEAIAARGPACPAAQAKSFLGEPSDPAVCGAP